MVPLDEVRRKRRSVSPLTVRERTIVELIADGRTNKETARILGISLKTVEAHRSSIMEKLQLP
jgi:DNA-binding CsgD family transcriptional regulator